MQVSVGIITIPFYIFFKDALNKIILYLGLIIYILFMISHLYTSLINPGLPNEEYVLENFNIAETKVKSYVICKKCKVIMDLNRGTEHCVDCDICIMENDHHCQWTSKCVGKNNLLIFNIFLKLLFINICYMFFALITIVVAPLFK